MNDKSGIDKLRKRLYSRAGDTSPKKRKTIRELEYGVGSRWKNRNGAREIKAPVSKKSILRTILIAAFLFFFASVGISAYVFLGGSNIVSSDNVKIRVEGPAAIDAGEELSLQISITNRNAVHMELTDLIIEYPEGTRSASDVNTELPRFRESVGTIRSGEMIQKTVRSILIGKEGSQKDIKVTIEYRIEGSNAIFFTEQIYAVTIGSSPLNLTISSVEETTSGQDMEFIITVSSNSNAVLENVLLTAEYPFGFKFASASPKPSFINSVWELGDIQPGSKREVVLRGIIIGEDEEERVFRFSGGLQSEKDEKELASALITSVETIRIKKPFISVNLALNGNTLPEFIARSGAVIRADVIWSNNLSVNVTDAQIEVKINGVAFDKFSVSTERGFYRSVDNTVIWNKATEQDLAVLNPGDSGRVSFSFASFGLSSGVPLKNPEITLEVGIKGRRMSNENVPEDIDSSIERKVKISSDLLLTSRVVHFVGPFINNGPIPPKAEKETTYTIIWTVNNSSNDISDAKVTTTLPSYVRWMGVFSPSNEKITFNPVGGQIEWNIGDIESKSGVLSTTGQREVAFQIALLPSISQIKTSPTIINKQTVSGFDEFTETILESIKPELTTRLSTDPEFKAGAGNVVE